jgi:putative endopeptidase
MTNNSTNTTYGDDFYNYVNNEWLKTEIIPDDYQRWGAFQLLEKETNEQIKQMLEQDNKDKNFLKIKTLYEQSNDINKRTELLNWENINKIIQTVKDCKDHKILFMLAANYNMQFGINLPINFSVSPRVYKDINELIDKNTKQNILHLKSGGLGLPDRDFYFLDSKKEIREEYIKFICEYGSLFDIKLNSENIFNLEKKLAEKTHDKLQKRDPELINNISTYNEFIINNPNLKYFFNITNVNIINIRNPNYMTYLNSLVETVDLESWKEYILFCIILEFNSYLSEEIEQCYFNFYSCILKGTNKMKPIEIRTIEKLNYIVGELIGKYYIDTYFSKESKMLALDIVNFIKDELKQYLTNNDWMEESTKEKALLKLDLMKIKIGFPNVIKKNYNDLDIRKNNTLIQNIINIHTFYNKYEIESLYKPIDRDKWRMNPQTVNAYYSPDMNEIVFPAGILQKPFFSVDQTIASNFAGFGVIVGHEITHGFDDEGSKFDAYGDLIKWWSDNDLIKYKEKTKMVEQQYNNYEIDETYQTIPFNRPRINGSLTLGENIADIGGLALSYNAFIKYKKQKNNKYTNKYKVYINYNDTQTYSDEQMFFINFANAWKTKGRKEDILNRLIIDVHSPPKFRVNGSIRNFDEFYKNFYIKETDKLYLHPNHRVRLWY